MNTPERAGQGPLIELANGQQWAMPPMPPSRARGSQSSGENRRYHHDPGVRQLTPGGFGSGPVEGLTTLPALLRHIRESLHWAPKRDVTVAVLVVPWETHGPTDIDPRSGDGVSRFHSQLREGDVVAQV